MSLNYDEILKYNVAAPRYTSYPPANLFKEESNDTAVVNDLLRSNREGTKHLSFYFHIPFCPKRCLFCGCQTEIGVGGHEKQRYFNSLFIEMDRVLPLLDGTRLITQIHFGGGTPNAVPFKYLAKILEKLKKKFSLAPWAEVAIECDPALLSAKKVAELGELGFNRISLGIQDLEAKVLDTVDRDPSRLPLEELVPLCRDEGMTSVNLDLIYGLPFQNEFTFNETIKKVLKINPDRIATFAYAHIPWIKGQQNELPLDKMPDAVARLKMIENTVRELCQAGYDWIGMDHFALPSDNLSKARKEGRLKRNFQGYCTEEHTGQVVAFGASAIGQLDSSYYQNVRTAEEYSNAIERGGLPVYRYYQLNQEEKYTAKVIESILCLGKVDLTVDLEQKIPPELRLQERFTEEINSLTQKGLILNNSGNLTLTEKGKWVVRYVAMHFDPKMNPEKNEATYSKAL